MHFVVPSWRGGSDPHSAGGKNQIQRGGGTKTGYSSWERRQGVGIRSDPAPRTIFHKTLVLCRLFINAIRSQGAVGERYVRILLSRHGGEAVTPNQTPSHIAEEVETKSLSTFPRSKAC